MKQLIYFSCMVIALSLASCTADKKDDPASPSPTTDDRDKFVGSWMCNETSQLSGSTSYPIGISKSTTNSSEIIINRFYDILSQDVRASVSGNAITIPYQQLGTVGFARGTGTLSTSGTNLSLAYTTTVSSNQDNCTASCAKQ